MSAELGRELKKLRIDEGLTLMEMAHKLGYSSAFLSSIENGKKRIPDAFLNQLVTAFARAKEEKNRYEILINKARKEVIVELKNASFKDAELATALARGFNQLSEAQKETILKTVNGGK